MVALVDLGLGRLDGGVDMEEVRSEIDGWQRAGVTGVPCFVFDRRYAVMGAQDVDILVRAIRTAAEAAEARAAELEAEVQRLRAQQTQSPRKKR